jgi:Protein of unknown function (DUF3014)
MTNLKLDDVQLDKWQGSFSPEPSRTGWRIAIVVIALAALAVSAYFLWWRRAQPPAKDVRMQTEQTVAQPAAPKAVAEPGDNIVLPPLEQSDAIVRELVAKLSSHPKVAAWLATDQLLRNFTVVVTTIGNGRTPSRQLTRLKPTGPFEIRKTGTVTEIDPRSYRRYDAYADAVAGLDAHGTARLYATLKPRIQDAYRELGNPDGNVDQALERAIRELLATPVIEGSVALASKSVAYEYADPRLQSLSSAQRQLLRMGPRNVRIIQAKLRELASVLGLSVDVH